MLPLILASSSIYRRGLLERLQLPFTTVSPGVAETPLTDESPRRMVTRLAQDKARAAARHHPRALIIGSDQAAVMDKTVLGKPGGREQAVAQLLQASGRRLTFMTALCLLNTATGCMQTDVVDYSVVFRVLDKALIEAYVDCDRPYDCAGAFKSEGLGIALVSRFEGDDPTALVGLPLIRLIDMLKQEGINVPTAI